MTITYRGSRRDQQIADEFNKTQAPCTFCTRLTDVDALSTYGARCFDCYREYCEQGRHYPSLTRHDRAAMAKKLRQVLAGGVRPHHRDYMADFATRVEAGELTSPGQRGFLSAARRPTTTTESVE